ncbi:Protein GVQW1 [Plecturocebus cupreus]
MVDNIKKECEFSSQKRGNRIWGRQQNSAEDLPDGFHYDGQASLELLTSGDPPTLASQSARITGVSHCAWPPVLKSLTLPQTEFGSKARLECKGITSNRSQPLSPGFNLRTQHQGNKNSKQGHALSGLRGRAGTLTDQSIQGGPVELQPGPVMDGRMKQERKQKSRGRAHWKREVLSLRDKEQPWLPQHPQQSLFFRPKNTSAGKIIYQQEEHGCRKSTPEIQAQEQWRCSPGNGIRIRTSFENLEPTHFRNARGWDMCWQREGKGNLSVRQYNESKDEDG